MAATHVRFSIDTRFGSSLADSLAKFEYEFERLQHIWGTLQRMINGDGSSDTHFTLVQEALGTDNVTEAKAAYDELASMMGKLTVADPSTPITAVNAAIVQAFGILRQR
jgi:hypothetical protein